MALTPFTYRPPISAVRVLVGLSYFLGKLQVRALAPLTVDRLRLPAPSSDHRHLLATITLLCLGSGVSACGELDVPMSVRSGAAKRRYSRFRLIPENERRPDCC